MHQIDSYFKELHFLKTGFSNNFKGLSSCI
nr:MAG TPA: hypothetical protein [Caudoviricetes sp.]